LEIEVKAESQDRALTALGVQAAVADLLGGKGEAMKAYTESIGIESTAGGAAKAKTPQGAKFANRLQQLLAKDEL
jgi:hypothetical protein